MLISTLKIRNRIGNGLHNFHSPIAMLSSLKLHLLGQNATPADNKLKVSDLSPAFHTRNTVHPNPYPLPTRTTDSADTLYGMPESLASEAARKEIARAVALTLRIRGRPTQKAPTLRLAVEALCGR